MPASVALKDSFENARVNLTAPTIWVYVVPSGTGCPATYPEKPNVMRGPTLHGTADGFSGGGDGGAGGGAGGLILLGGAQEVTSHGQLR